MSEHDEEEKRKRSRVPQHGEDHEKLKKQKPMRTEESIHVQEEKLQKLDLDEDSIDPIKKPRGVFPKLDDDDELKIIVQKPLRSMSATMTKIASGETRGVRHGVLETAQFDYPSSIVYDQVNKCTYVLDVNNERIQLIDFARRHYFRYLHSHPFPQAAIKSVKFFLYPRTIELAIIILYVLPIALFTAYRVRVVNSAD